METKSPEQALKLMRNWILQVRRSEQLNASMPDPVLMIMALNTITRRPIMASATTTFRWQTYMTTHRLPQAATMEHVRNMYAFLEVELKELMGPGTGTGTLTVSGDGAAPTVKALIQKWDGDKKKQDQTGKGRREECEFFKKSSGCKWGQKCLKWHPFVGKASGRCYVCGSTEHTAAGCTRPRVDGNPKGKDKDKKSPKGKEKGNPKGDSKGTRPPGKGPDARGAVASAPPGLESIGGSGPGVDQPVAKSYSFISRASPEGQHGLGDED